MIKSGDVLICIENIPAIIGDTNLLPLLKPLHVKLVTHDETLIFFEEIKETFYMMKHHKFINSSEYRKLKLKNLNDKTW